MSKDDKAKLDQLTAGIEEGTPSIKDISDRVEAIETADIKTTIPIQKNTESLNLSVAGSIMFYITTPKTV